MSAIDQIPRFHEKYLTARILQRKEVKMSRTSEVKARLGPIMERMKSSLAQIQQIEESIESRKKDEAGEGETETALVAVGKSRSKDLMKASMDMLKKKLVSLQRLEEVLQTAEDRRQNLQHYFLQASLSKPMLELASARRRNKDLERKLETMENEKNDLEERCNTVESLEQKIIDLKMKLRHYDDMVAQVEIVTAQNEAYSQDLVERQAKLNEQSVRCDDLECQIEQLVEECNNLRTTLQSEHERVEILEAQLFQSKQRSESKPKGECRRPSTIKSLGSGESEATALTECDNDSITMTSRSSDSTSPCEDGGNSVESVDNSSGTGESNPLDHTVAVSDDVNISGFSDDTDISSGVEGTDMKLLLDKIAKLEQENSCLRKAERLADVKAKRLNKQNLQQAERIKRLEGNRADLPADSTEGTNIEKGGRSTFFKSFLKRDTPAGSSADIARRVSEALTTGAAPQ